MTDASIIQGSLVDVRNVNQHKCVRLLIDVPAELAPKVMEAFGWPTMANPVPVAIAHLTAEAAGAKPEKKQRTWSELSRAEQAGIACEDRDFRVFLSRYTGRVIVRKDADETAKEVRLQCAVQSRADLDKDNQAAEKWDKLYSDYQLWKRGAAA